MEGKRDHFLEFIRHTLIHHDESSIKELEIYIEECDFDIKNEWVTIAVQHNVEKLALHGLVEDQQLPGCLFKCSSLITMNLVTENLLLKWPMDSAMPNLKNLKIDSVILSEENFILDLSSSCPALESLSLTLCNVMTVKVLSISSGRLKCLFIAGCQGITECFVKLDTPRLEHFFYMDFVARDYSFTNMSSLSLGCVWLGDGHQMQQRDDYSRCAIKVFQALCNGKHLTFNQPFMEFLSRAHYVWRQLTAISLDKLEGLTLYLWPTKEQVQMALLLLGRCPRIRALIIDFARSEGRLPDVLDQDVEFGNLASPLMFEQLTYIRIENFGGYKSEMELARVLFENAPDTGKMEIVTELSLTSTERKLKMAEILMLKGASNVNLHIT
ncbi:hypothetical protein Vadar_022172 [Vaccinium darrowii]|uniref:Uncharacterized protein n=1 Tax=Vaccinium darrowii TaxID=229202 RepID=A0ACB7Y878_9ERIC|nr:hypothetical protein Vadar_022172 [Vaccinium darrowii]